MSHTTKIDTYMIVRVEDVLKIGKDLVDATTGKPAAQGKLTVKRENIDVRYCAPKELAWISTANCVVSERVLRRSVKQEGHIITYFESQGVGA